MPEGAGAAGMEVCSSDAGGERPPHSQLCELAAGKKSSLGNPLAKQELLRELGVRRWPGYSGGRAPRTLLFCRALLPTTVWLGSTGLQ